MPIQIRGHANLPAILSTLIASLVPLLAATAQPITDQPITDQQRDEAFNLRAGTHARVPDPIAMPPHGQSRTVLIDAGPDTFSLILERSDPRGPGYQLLIQGADGSIVPAKPGPARTMTGRVEGVPGSRVAATLTEHGLIARIRYPQTDPRSVLGDHWLEPLATKFANAQPGEHVLYSNADVIPSFRLCATEPVVHLLEQDPPAADQPLPIAPRRTNAADPSDTIPLDARDIITQADAAGDGEAEPFPPLYIADLGCDADYEYFLAYDGSVEAVEQRIIELVNLVNLQYVDEVEIRHDISAILVRTAEPDPYESTNSGQLLAQFRNEWLTNQQHIPHDVAMLFTGKEIDGSIIGQASTLGGICTPLRYCHGQVECCGSTACATDLVAHELGHLWDGRHCSCSSPDFTMNPFITCSNTFQPALTRPTIRAHRDSRTCLGIELSPGVPINDNCGLAIDLPLGTSTFSTSNAFTSGPLTIEQCGQGIQRDVWFRYRGQGFNFVTIDLCGSDFDTKIAVYKDNCPSAPNAFRCDDDGSVCPNNPFASRVTFPSAYGVDFFIEIGSPNGTVGDITMTVTIEPFNQSCAADINADGIIDTNDLSTLLANFGATGQDAPGNINNDNIVNVNDLSILLSSFGNQCP